MGKGSTRASTVTDGGRWWRTGLRHPMGIDIGLGCGELRSLDRIWPIEVACYTGGPSSKAAPAMMLAGTNDLCPCQGGSWIQVGPDARVQVPWHRLHWPILAVAMTGPLCVVHIYNCASTYSYPLQWWCVSWTPGWRLWMVRLCIWLLGKQRCSNGVSPWL